jgi:hypothetical protein
MICDYDQEVLNFKKKNKHSEQLVRIRKLWNESLNGVFLRREFNGGQSMWAD